MRDPILVTLLKMQHHYSQSSRENTTPSSGISPLASYKEVPAPLPPLRATDTFPCPAWRVLVGYLRTIIKMTECRSYQ